MRIYLAAPLFTQAERAWNRALADEIAAAFAGAEVILPQDFRPAGRYNDDRHYSALFDRCLGGLRRADAVVAVLDGADVDSGVAFEIGFAHALGKPVLGVRTDYRPGADRGLNLMCARACRFLAREFAFQEDWRAAAAGIVRRLKALGETPAARRRFQSPAAKDGREREESP